MPNWCNNNLELRHKDLRKLKTLSKKAKEGNLFAYIIPEPNYKTTPVVKAYPEISAQYKKGKEKKIALANKPTIREDSWWDWRVLNWGTKWDIGDAPFTNSINNSTGVRALHLAFETAWSPPINIYEALKEQGYYVRAFYNEPGCDFAGEWENGNDNVINNISEMDDEYFEKDDLGKELDDFYGILETRAEYEDIKENLREEKRFGKNNG